MGIPSDFCVCHPLYEIPLSDSNLQLAAVQAVNTLNSDLLNGTRCSPLKLTQVTAGAVKEKGVGGSVKDYIVGFVTSPGSFLIEAVVEHSVPDASFNVSLAKIVRASRMNKDDSKCVKDAKLELFCYCSRKEIHSLFEI
jgi:hypothetical protein